MKVLLTTPIDRRWLLLTHNRLGRQLMIGVANYSTIAAIG
jgi:hypothetical protein